MNCKQVRFILPALTCEGNFELILIDFLSFFFLGLWDITRHFETSNPSIDLSWSFLMRVFLIKVESLRGEMELKE